MAYKALPVHIRYKVIYSQGEFKNANALSRLTKDIEEQKLLLLLNKNDIFSEGLHDLGRTHLTEQNIDTADAPPVKLPH